LVRQFLSRLVKLLGNFLGGSFVNELQRHQRQPWSRDGFHPIIPAQLLESFLQRLSYEILHFLGGCSGPHRGPREPFDREGGIFRSSQMKIGINAGTCRSEDEEQCDGAFPHRQSREIKTSHRISSPRLPG